MKVDLKSLYYVAIHCTNNEQATKVIEILAEAGFEWGNIVYHKEVLNPKNTFWFEKNGGTCYIFDEGTIWTGSIEYCEEEDIDLLSYEEATERLF